MSRTSTEPEPAGVCVVCRTAPGAGEELVRCPECGCVHHRECWDYNAGCGKYGCPQAPQTDKLSDMEIPPSFWGQTEKECPQCRQMIQAAALRCRFCGATFASTRPVGANEFFAEKRLEAGAVQAGGGVIWLLVGSMIPCTAPIAAVVGGTWYLRNRTAIARLPALRRALVQISLVVALVQTVTMIVVGVLYGLLRG